MFSPLKNTVKYVLVGVLLMGIVFLVISNFTFKDNNTTEENTTIKSVSTNFIPNANYEYGVWVWSSPFVLGDKIYSTINDTKLAEFNAIYISIDDFLSTDKAYKQRYFEELEKFISYANFNDIDVDVVVGSKEWAQPKNRWKAYSFIDFAIEYNNEYPNAKIRGLQYDIEPYLLSNYENNKESVLSDFVEFIDIASTRISEHKNFELSVVLPHFYDSKQKWTPLITYNGVTLSTFDHVVDSLNKIDNSSILLMSYRNFFDGNNGVDDISRAEIKTRTNNPKIIIAQEVGDIYPRYATFYGTSKKRLFEQLNTIYNEYKNMESFRGLAIDHFSKFIELP